MKTKKSWLVALATVACGAFMLSLLCEVALADKKPPAAPVLWPSGAKVVANAGYSYNLLVYLLHVSWPTAPGADHYRVTWVTGHKNLEVGSTSPLYGTSFATGIGSGSCKVTVTAYSGPDEATAYSESIQTSLTIPSPPR